MVTPYLPTMAVRFANFGIPAAEAASGALGWQSQQLTLDGAGRQPLDHVPLQQSDQDYRWQ